MKLERRIKSIKSGFQFLVLFLLLINNVMLAQVEVSGFFDAINSYDINNSLTNGFDINQFEIDFEYIYNDKISMGGAVAYNNETGNMQLAVANIHYNLVGREDYHRRYTETFKHLAINIGQNDVVFGLDYLSLPSPDRTVISQPIIVEKTIGGWNDIGVNLHGIMSVFSFDLNVVNGFNDGINLGGKISVSPFSGFSVGVSHASDFASMDDRNNWVTGTDILWKNSSFEIKSEYLIATGLMDGEQDTLGTDQSSDGFYVQGIMQTDEFIDLPFFVTLRFGQWNLDGDRNLNGINDTQDRISFGVGYQIMESFSLRSEYLYDKFDNDETDQTIAVQAVVSF